ncbi:hypothetical protein JT359_10720 [Candidatus Poribacteria bacterium]|nr:hypothetical protein [Candidatus Poribacteria bacterium]
MKGQEHHSYFAVKTTHKIKRRDGVPHPHISELIIYSSSSLRQKGVYW